MGKLLHQRPRSESSLSGEWSLGWADYFRILDENNFQTPILDICASKDNTKAPLYFTKNDNSLEKDWQIFPNDAKETHVYVNPPNDLTQLFIKKADDQSKKWKNLNILMLIPINATVTKNGKKYIWDNDQVEIRPVLPTPKFIYKGKQGESARNRYCVVIWRKKHVK